MSFVLRPFFSRFLYAKSRLPSLEKATLIGSDIAGLVTIVLGKISGLSNYSNVYAGRAIKCSFYSGFGSVIGISN